VAAYCNNLTLNPENVATNQLEKLLNSEDSIYVYDLKLLKNLKTKWDNLMPNITPYYAVKCNPNPEIIKTLAKENTFFDCASPNEIKLVLDSGISPDRIIYANPCKKESDILYAKQNNINLTTFDNECELEKIARLAPETKLILRIYANDSSAQCVLSNKYGALESEWISLIEKAKILGIHKNIIGISFHIGSGANDPTAYDNAIFQCRKLYDIMTNEYTLQISILDIGGGFTVHNLGKMSNKIFCSINSYFSYTNIKIIAEPGRYFAETIATLYTKIINIRIRNDIREYWITDSLYGSFNCKIYDHCILKPEPLKVKDKENNTNNSKTIIWGPTCDSFDKIIDLDKFQILDYGDWVYWKNAGAYTIAAACEFNGIPLTKPINLYI